MIQLTPSGYNILDIVKIFCIDFIINKNIYSLLYSLSLGRVRSSNNFIW